MRVAQSNSKLGCTDISLRKYEFCYNAIKNFEDTGCKFCDALPEADYRHIKIFLPVLYGYELWKKQRLLSSSDTEQIELKFNLLVRAYEITLEALSFTEKKERIFNNLLYYTVDIVSLSSRHNLESSITKENIENHLSSLLQTIDIEQCDDIFDLDTIAKAYDLLGKIAEAHKTVDRIISCTLDRSKTSSYDDLGLEIAREAYEMKKKYLSQN
jgi:hypothetical protein